jgi:hypothetical protein
VNPVETDGLTPQVGTQSSGNVLNNVGRARLPQTFVEAEVQPTTTHGHGRSQRIGAAETALAWLRFLGHDFAPLLPQSLCEHGALRIPAINEDAAIHLVLGVPCPGFCEGLRVKRP